MRNDGLRVLRCQSTGGQTHGAEGGQTNIGGVGKGKSSIIATLAENEQIPMRTVPARPRLDNPWPN